MNTMTITIHATNLITANQIMHWARRADIVRTLRRTGLINARKQGIAPMERAHLTVYVSWQNARRRDVSNISPTIKALVDGIVEAGILPDDDDLHLTGPDLRVTSETSGLKGVTRLTFVFSDYVEKVA